MLKLANDSREAVDWHVDLTDAMKYLTEKQREVLAYWLAGYTQEEIGARLFIDARNVRGRLSRAVQRLHAYLN